MIRIAHDILNDPHPIITAVKWVDAGNGLSAALTASGKYLSQRGDGSWGESAGMGSWEKAKLNGQMVVYRSDVTSGPIYFTYTWAETPS